LASRSDIELAKQKPEGSYARIDAIKAAKRRVLSDHLRGERKPVDLDAIIEDGKAEEQADFDALIAAIDGCELHSPMKGTVLKSILRKRYPHLAGETA